MAVFAPRTINADISRPRYNIAPMQRVPVITGRGEDRTLRDCQWGLIPGWARDPAVGNRMINARVETVAVKPAFRTAFRLGRCLIPADGFYEWQQFRTGKQPFLIRALDNEPFAFAGLYSPWTGGGSGQVLLSCVILTRQADNFIAPVHDRMPVIVPEAFWETWTDPEQTSETVLRQILAEPFGEKLGMTKVSNLVNSPANDSEQCIEPAVDEDLPDAGG